LLVTRQTADSSGLENWITELTPLSFLERCADVHPDKVAVVYGPDRWTYRDLAQRVQELATALRATGVGPGERVACLLPNVPEMLVAHFAVPLAGAVLVAINTRLSSEEVRYICDHSGAVLLAVDAAFAPTVAPVAASLETVRTIVTLVDPHGPPAGEPIPGSIAYADLLARATGETLPWKVDDERATISINYTSGTTGRPKGVVYCHRGAYLNALGEVLHLGCTHDSVYLWTLPMFHCNGWCTAWALVAIGGTQVCLREVRGEAIWQLIDDERVTHLNGAPRVVASVLDDPRAHALDHRVVITTAAAPPSPMALARAERMGFSIVHVYGLTETYGPYAVCQWQHRWDGLDPEQRARLRARQGVGMIQAERMRVVASELCEGQLVDVPADGATWGEIVMRGNNVMKGYYRDPDATAAAFAGGWFHSGDLGVMHPDGYVELRDRAKDVVISGGENISTIEVEQAVLAHDAVLDTAVIGVPDEKWGERPKAFVVLKPGATATEAELIDHVRGRIAHYKAPREVEFVDALPMTSTGKPQKFALREKEWAGRTSRIKG
jgi:fatty-acyl-CoA synthase